MRIHYLSSSELISTSANSVHVMRMANAFAELGHETTLHALRGHGGSCSDVRAYYGVSKPFDIVRYGDDAFVVRALKALRHLKAPTGFITRLVVGATAVRNAIVKHPADVIYSRNAEWLLASLSPEVRFIHESHSPPANLRDRLIDRQLFQRRGFAGLVVITEPLKAAYMSAYPYLPADKILVAADGADEAGPVGETPPPTDQRLQVGYVGHLYPGRGGELIVDIARAIPDAEFHLVGGLPEDISRLTQRGVPKNLVCHGHVPPAKLPSFYSSFDVVLAPYQSRVAVAGGQGNTVDWMSPLKIFEYMSWGKAIIASDLPVLHEVLKPNETAVLLPPQNTEVWVAELRRLMESPAERRRLGENARKVFLERYTWRGRASRILDTFVGASE